ncbi:MAG: AbrB/MazE/SpoVT family DNA-binding domain-containing protein [Alphaproteobacteria bacterium]
MASAKVTSKGQITLPKAIRDALGVGTGDRVEFLVEPDGTVTVVSATIDLADLKGCLPRPERPVSLEEMEAAIAAGARRDR